jgi:hypothetical protein
VRRGIQSLIAIAGIDTPKLCGIYFHQWTNAHLSRNALANRLSYEVSKVQCTLMLKTIHKMLIYHAIFRVLNAVYEL